ncbi:MAG: HU family DNA-binding protein [Spirochaetaceae bacterium]|nr:HU family DNA-binding protein [Spirochaetaceae bacterium]
MELRGFGTFDVIPRKSRDNARNPQTSEVVSVPEHFVVKFRPGKEIEESLKNCDLQV